MAQRNISMLPEEFV